jgi:hypothetical protein
MVMKHIMCIDERAGNKSNVQLVRSKAYIYFSWLRRKGGRGGGGGGGGEGWGWGDMKEASPITFSSS